MLFGAQPEDVAGCPFGPSPVCLSVSISHPALGLPGFSTPTGFLPSGFLLGLFIEEPVDDRQEEGEVFTPLAPSTSWWYSVMDSHCSSTKGPPLGPGPLFYVVLLATLR